MKLRPANSPASLVHRARVDAHAVWLAARDPHCPWPARLVGLAVAAYALSPLDLIPDFIPILGLVDDIVLIPLGVWLFVKLLPDGLFAEHRIAAAQTAERPLSIWGAVLVVAIWVLSAILIWRLFAHHFD